MKILPVDLMYKNWSVGYYLLVSLMQFWMSCILKF